MNEYISPVNAHSNRMADTRIVMPWL